MKSIITLLLILATFSSINGGYSIDEFLNYLQEKGIYELLVEIKRYLGNDVSIDFCKQLFPTKDCETVVRVYIPNGVRPDNPGDKKTLEQLVNEYKQILIDAGFYTIKVNKKVIELEKDKKEYAQK